MNTLATELRNAVLDVLCARFTPRELTDEDYAVLNLLFAHGQFREGSGSIGQELLKSQADNRGRPWTLPDPNQGPGRGDPGPTGAQPPAARLGDAMPPAATLSTMPPPSFPGMPASGAPAPSTDEQQESLPLGTADRGPDPQSIGTLLSTEAPLDGAQVDPTDPPYDYSRLPVQAPKPVV
jgi:hypothetical protein